MLSIDEIEGIKLKIIIKTVNHVTIIIFVVRGLLSKFQM